MVDNGTGVPVEGTVGRALVVDDNEINAQIAAIQLQDIGFEVDCVSNGAKAVETFKASETDYYSIIIMDIMMPVMDGLEATKRIRDLERTDALRVPIVAISANTFQIDENENTDKSGISCFLTKPYSRKTMQETVLGLTDKMCVSH